MNSYENQTLYVEVFMDKIILIKRNMFRSKKGEGEEPPVKNQ
jgi:hypothetical protein